MNNQGVQPSRPSGEGTRHRGRWNCTGFTEQWYTGGIQHLKLQTVLWKDDQEYPPRGALNTATYLCSSTFPQSQGVFSNIGMERRCFSHEAWGMGMVNSWREMPANTDRSACSSHITARCHLLQLQTRLQHKTIHMPKLWPALHNCM